MTSSDNIDSNYFDEKAFDNETFRQSFTGKPTEFVNCSFSSVDFSGSSLLMCKFIECFFQSCNLNNVSIAKGVFRENNFTNCKMLGLNWAGVKTFSSGSFSECQMDYSVFQGLTLKAVSFTNCSLKEADFYEANLSKANFSESILTRATFNKSNLTEADFRKAQDYSIDLNQCIIKMAKFSMPEALSLLNALEIVLE